MSNSILYRMAAGIPGAVSRPSFSSIEGQALDSTAPFAAYGIPAKFVNGKMQPVSGATDLVAGFLARPFPITGPDASDPIGTAVPPTSGMGNLMRVGYMTVLNLAGAAAQGGQVYVRVANAVAPQVIGGIEAAAAYQAPAAAAAAGNTGNGTVGALAAASPALNGVYTLVMETATRFEVFDPNGALIGTGVAGTAFSEKGVSLTVTAGATAFAAGDSFDITVSANTVAIPHAQFMSGADASGNVEISYRV